MLTFNNCELDLRSIPGEICLTFYICDCPCHCQGCSSPWLWLPGKRELTSARMHKAMEKLPYATCILFMGGDNDPEAVFELAADARAMGRKAAWYSGRGFQGAAVEALDYYKVGPWLPDYGPLTATTTNQRLYQIVNGHLVNITNRFWTRENTWQPQQEETIQRDVEEWRQSIVENNKKKQQNKL